MNSTTRKYTRAQLDILSDACCLTVFRIAFQLEEKLTSNKNMEGSALYDKHDGGVYLCTATHFGR